MWTKSGLDSADPGRFDRIMLVLAIDTALDACSAAILGGRGKILSRSTRDIGRGHAEVLMAVVAETFADAGAVPSDIDRVVVTVGPGSFTGIRVGLAAARGFGLAAGVPVIGVSTLEAIAAEAAGLGGPVLVTVDARRGEVYAGLYGFGAGGDPAAVGSPAALTLLEAADLACETGAVPVGSGAMLVSDASGGRVRAGPAIRFPDIGCVARIGAAAPIPDQAPKPLYLRAADAKPQEGFRIARTGSSDFGQAGVPSGQAGSGP